MKVCMSLNFGQISSTHGLSVLEHLKNYLYNVVNTLAPSILIRCSSFLQIHGQPLSLRMRSYHGLGR